MNDLIETAWLNWLNGAYCARAALAEPEPVGPTDEELVKHYARSVTSAIDSRVAMHLLTDEDLDAATAAGLRAVLARWGRPASTSVAELSPAAQAVLDAAQGAYWKWDADCPADAAAIAAAALRAAADQVLAVQWEGRIEPDAAHSLGINWTRDALHAIAAELEVERG